MNTYLMYCRFQQMRGGFSDGGVRARDRSSVREMPRRIDEPHWREYLAAWPEEPTAAEAPAAAVPEVAIATASATVVTVTATVAGLAAAVQPPARSNP